MTTEKVSKCTTVSLASH